MQNKKRRKNNYNIRKSIGTDIERKDYTYHEVGRKLMQNMGLREMLLKKEQELEKLVHIAEKHIDSPVADLLK